VASERILDDDLIETVTYIPTGRARIHSMMQTTDPLPIDEEAMIVPVGAPMEPGCALFVGNLQEARARVAAMSSAEAAEIAIWTPGHIFTASDLLSEIAGHEHDPIS
jgi:hypothetical protein